MAYPISATVKAALDKAATQGCNLSIFVGSQAYYLTERNVLSLSIDRASANGRVIAIGAVISTELTITLDNHTGTYDDTDFEGATINASIRVAGSSIPLGDFKVLEQPEINKDLIKLKAYDFITKLDSVVTDAQWNNLTFPCTVAQMIVWACNTCGVPYRVTTGLPNRLYSINEKPQTANVTFHRLISWCCEIQGCCAYMDYLGYLSWGMYNNSSPAMTLAEENRYTSEIGGKDITITGVKIVDLDGEEHISGTSNYMLTISGNDLIQTDIDTVVANLGTVWNGFTYRSTSSSTLPYPHIFPCDTLRYTYKKHNGTLVTVNAIVTHIKYNMNGKTQIEGRGESSSTYSGNTYGSFISSSSVKSNMLQIGGFEIKDGLMACGGNSNLPIRVRVNNYESLPSVFFQIGSPATSDPYIIFQETDTQGIYEAKIQKLKIYRTKDNTWITLNAWLDDIDNMLYN